MAEFEQVRYAITVAPTAEPLEVAKVVSEVVSPENDYDVRSWDPSPGPPSAQGRTLGAVLREGPLTQSSLRRMAPGTYADGVSISADPIGASAVRVRDGNASLQTHGHDDCWCIWSFTSVIGTPVGDIVESGLEILRFVLARLPILGAELRRSGEVALSPLVPHAPNGCIAWLASDSAVAEDYEDPQAYFEQWDGVADFGEGRRLVTRLVQEYDRVEFLRGCLERSIALAGYARGSKTKFVPCDRDRLTASVLRKYPKHLEVVEYERDAQHLTLRVEGPGGTALSPADLLEIVEYLHRGLKKTSPVQTLELQHADGGFGASTARILADLGVKVTVV